jgi:hypothetical protein
MVDVARRLCDDNHIHVSQIHSFHFIGDQARFTLVHRSREQPPAPPSPPRKPAAPRAAAPARAKTRSRPPRAASRARKPAKNAARPQKRR